MMIAGVVLKRRILMYDKCEWKDKNGKKCGLPIYWENGIGVCQVCNELIVPSCVRCKMSMHEETVFANQMWWCECGNVC